ncbi:MAG: carbamoyltransferase HypF [Gammaproteobacteria bacterium]|nr:carbamoyltransferase HypF [Gammaproteobacteria bacterium]
MQRLQLNITGLVQGVGFRPYVYKLASALSLSGFVRNDAYGVHIEIQGKECDTFIECLRKDLPPLASIETLQQKKIDLKQDETHFLIEKSEAGIVSSKIPADAAICESCLADLFDLASPFYRYPFISCTQCGPRYTIAQQLPYDRHYTSQNDFGWCLNCHQFYNDPHNRRYHNEAIACTHCGPQLSHTIEEVSAAISQGEIVALKSLGGYQLICDARNLRTLQKLRRNKLRATKPFALMALNTDCVAQFVDCPEVAKAVLKDRARPIVVLNKKEPLLPEELAPGLNSLGFMLPYTATHYLLFHTLLGSPLSHTWWQEKNDLVLVVTSANVSEMPLIKDNNEAHQQLNIIADLIVTCNRDIVSAIDDSVLQLIHHKPAFIRRARAYVPEAILLPQAVPCTLALGGYLKNTFCITRGNEAFVSQPLGNLNNRDTIRFYHDTIQHLLKILNVKPECIAHDKHPDFYSTQIALQFNAPAFAIQHHHAHLAACAVEHRLSTPALGLALDGFGLGDDNQSWGGELLYYHGTDYKRLASLQPLLQPGGDIVSKQPWRMAVSVLFALGQQTLISKRFGHHTNVEALISLLEKGVQCPATSSCGRLFDATSALLGICENSDYEGQAAMLLESCVSAPTIDPTGWSISDKHLNMLPLFHRLLTCNFVEGANLFHGTLVAALVAWIERIAQLQGLKQVLLSGGCFLNRILSDNIIAGLELKGFVPLYPRLCPPNDSGLSLGQAWIGANKLIEGL